MLNCWKMNSHGMKIPSKRPFSIEWIFEK